MSVLQFNIVFKKNTFKSGICEPINLYTSVPNQDKNILLYFPTAVFPQQDLTQDTVPYYIYYNLHIYIYIIIVIIIIIVYYILHNNSVFFLFCFFRYNFFFFKLLFLFVVLESQVVVNTCRMNIITLYEQPTI